MIVGEFPQLWEQEASMKESTILKALEKALQMIEGI